MGRRFCTFYLASHHFGIEVERIQEILRYQEMTAIPQAPVEVSGLINLRGQIVPAIELRRRLGMPERGADLLPTNVVLLTEDGAVSLLVDEIGDVLEVDEASFEAPPDNLRGVSRELIRGVYKLAHGLLLVLDAEVAVSGSTTASR
jgi:purine-binding chemotaxis protein CheW